MTSREYSKLIDYYTELSRTDPRRHRLGLGLFSFLGVFVLLVTLALAALMIISLKAFLVIAGVLMLYGIFRVVFYRTPAPEGYALKQADAPELYRDVDEVCERLGAGKCDGILLDYEFNAAAIQFHTAGLFGLRRNFLLLGVPLLDGLGRDHARSTITHEVGHLMLKHGTKARRWYAIADMYRSLHEQVEGGLLGMLYTPFTRWYVPRLYARLQPVSLQAEFEADSMEAKVTSTKTAAEALCLLGIGASRTNEAIYEYCKATVAESREAQPQELAAKVYEALRSWTREDHTKRLEKDIRRVTDIEGSHPALAERLENLGEACVALDPVEEPASDAYFGQNRTVIAARAAEMFLRSDAYRSMAEEMLGSAEAINRLGPKVQSKEATQAEVEEYVFALAHLENPSLAEHVESGLVQFPNSANLHYSRGVLRLRADNEEGLQDLLAAMQLDEASTGYIAESIYQYLLSKGRAEEARMFRNRRDDFSDRVRTLYDERLKISKAEQYEPANLSEHEIEGIHFVLRQVKSLGEAYVVRRVSDGPIEMYDIVVFPKKYRIVSDANAMGKEIEQALSPLGKAFAVFFGPWVEKSVRERIKNTPGSKVYEA